MTRPVCLYITPTQQHTQHTVRMKQVTYMGQLGCPRSFCGLSAHVLPKPTANKQQIISCSNGNRLFGGHRWWTLRCHPLKTHDMAKFYFSHVGHWPTHSSLHDVAAVRGVHRAPSMSALPQGQVSQHNRNGRMSNWWDPTIVAFLCVSLSTHPTKAPEATHTRTHTTDIDAQRTLSQHCRTNWRPGGKGVNSESL